MTARTERHPAVPDHGIAGGGRKGMPKGGTT